jgi:hypothetical protein
MGQKRSTLFVVFVARKFIKYTRKIPDILAIRSKKSSGTAAKFSRKTKIHHKRTTKLRNMV